MSRIIIIIVIIVILAGGSFLFLRNGLIGKKSLPPPKVQAEIVKKITPTPTPIPTPIPTQLDYKIDLNKELESINPQVLEEDFDQLSLLISSF